MNDCAFDVPVMLQSQPNEPIKTVQQAADILRAHLQLQFTIVGLNTLLVLERAAEGAEIEEARQAFCRWASEICADRIILTQLRRAG
jgi:hypothetical protein